jgi:hypothetical protein
VVLLRRVVKVLLIHMIHEHSYADRGYRWILDPFVLMEMAGYAPPDVRMSPCFQ